MAVARYLVDTSVAARLHLEPVQETVGPLLHAGLLATCGSIELEVGFTARSASALAHLREQRAEAYEWLPTEDSDLRRAQEVQEALSSGGRHRSVPPADLVIAAVAERHRVVLLHYDSDFDRIAEVTGQRAQWVVPRGTL